MAISSAFQDVSMWCSRCNEPTILGEPCWRCAAIHAREESKRAALVADEDFERAAMWGMP
jgi:hypothetical protein